MILAIESSCDESSLALFEPKEGLVGEWVHTQIALHGEYGGVVPDLASREHLANFPYLLREMHTRLGDNTIDRVAVTYGPGLAGCLAMGISLAKSLSMVYGCRLLGVNHLRGHAFSPFIKVHQDSPRTFDTDMQRLLPHLGLIVSGGNTILFRMDRDRTLQILAQTVDDAAGEALDKGAKLLGLGYPGGPLIEKTAHTGKANAYDFPRAFPAQSDMRFSFSGLKTSLRYQLEKMSDDELAQHMPDICASYQEAVVDALIRKMRQALSLDRYASIGLSGGVANNGRLRQAITDLGKRKKIPVLIAEPKHTGDNASMIAFASYSDPTGIVPAPGLALSFNPSVPLAFEE